MDDIKQFANNEKKKLESLIQTIRIYSQDRGMESVIEKCAMLLNRSGKRQIREGIEKANQEIIRMLGEKEIYMYLEIFEAGTTKQTDKKEKY